MTIRQLKLLCWTLTGALCAGAIAVIVAVIVVPVTASPAGDESDTQVKSHNTSRVGVKVSMMDFEPYLSGTLRAAPQVAAPVVQQAEAPPPPVQTSELQLLGTVTEKDNSIAIIKAGDMVEFKKLGEKINDAEVTEISEGVAVLKRNGEPLTLRVPLPPG